jgi:transcription elongation factor Elf1
MATSTTFFQCEYCGEGRVKKKIRATRLTVSIAVGNCNKCGKPGGEKGVVILGMAAA